MGAWGHRNFENDTALDLVANLYDENMDKEDIFIAINEVATFPPEADSQSGPESDECATCLAAIEFIAASKGKPSEDFPEDAEEWLGLNPDLTFPGTDITTLCLQAINQIRTASELKELWKESEFYQKWLDVVADLEKRIQ